MTFARPFRRYSAFHRFIEFVVDRIIDDEVSEIDLEGKQEIARNFESLPNNLRPNTLPINEALHHHRIEHEPFDEWLAERDKLFADATPDDVSDYYLELQLQGPYDELLEQVVREVFFVLFQNRRLLLLFNEMMAGQIIDTDARVIPTEDRKHFTSKGSLKRVAMPTWVKRAVYFRDRGHCTICHRDLSGVLSIGARNNENYDHIVPLAQGGLNDISNVQLLCKDCNTRKLHHRVITSDYYENWYQM